MIKWSRRIPRAPVLVSLYSYDIVLHTTVRGCSILDTVGSYRFGTVRLIREGAICLQLCNLEQTLYA